MTPHRRRISPNPWNCSLMVRSPSCSSVEAASLATPVPVPASMLAGRVMSICTNDILRRGLRRHVRSSTWPMPTLPCTSLHFESLQRVPSRLSLLALLLLQLQLLHLG